MPSDSTRTVLVALGAGLGVALAKVGAAVFTGSAALAAEAAHSLADSGNDLIRRARHYHREFLEETRVTSDPSLRAVFVEDAVSVSGDVIAFVALALNQITGSSIPQGVAAVLIALVLIRVSLRLIQRSHDFLVGSWTGVDGGPQDHDAAGFTQPLQPADKERIRAVLLGHPGVTAIRELLFTFVGPGQVWVVARVSVDDGLRGSQVAALVRGIERSMKHEAKEVYRVDVVPIPDHDGPRPVPSAAK
jgi:divalent metal cation (Fe/Co/Zn/Cd) transporter